jgi:hypothetical protein
MNSRNFFRHSAAPVTVLVTKDRVTGHNRWRPCTPAIPVIAICAKAAGNKAKRG